MLNELYKYISIQTLAWLIIALPLTGSAINGLIAVATASRRIGSYRPVVSFAGVFLPMLSFLCSLLIFTTMLSFKVGEP